MFGRMSVATALLIDDRTVLHQKGSWSTTYDVSQLPQKIAFYEGLRDKRGPGSQPAYDSDVEALRNLHQQLEGPANG